MNNSKEKISVLNIGPKLVDGKTKYRMNHHQLEEKKKFTYNFTTDPRLKRGLNLGVVYLTNETLEDEPQVNKRKEQAEKRKNNINLEIDTVDAPDGRHHVACKTSPVNNTLLPKPLTFEFEVQTEEKWREKPEFIPYWPKQTGLEKEVQIEDGDLFDFDYEVLPILNVLLGKILQKSRMEVLEEEEIKEMNSKQKYYQNLKNKEMADTKMREEEEIKRKERNEQRKLDQSRMRKTTQICQKKLFSRNLAKEYLKILKPNIMNELVENRFFRDQSDMQYYHNLNKYLTDSSAHQNFNDGLLESYLNTSVSKSFNDNTIKLHRQSLVNEIKRKENAEKDRLIKIQLDIEDRKRRRQAIMKKKKDQELKELRDLLQEEIIKNNELVDDIMDIADVNGSYQIGKKQVNVPGGFIGQWALLIGFLNSKSAETITSDKLQKILELFIPKMGTFNILYKPEIVEKLKLIDAGIEKVEDISRVSDEETFKKLCGEFIKAPEIVNPIFGMFLRSFIRGGSKIQAEEAYLLTMITIMKLIRTVTDSNIIDKIKIAAKDPSITEDNYKAIGILEVPVIHKVVVATTMKKAAPKAKVPSKQASFEPSFQEKIAIHISLSDKLKMIIFNHAIEKPFRALMLDCVNLIHKFDDIDKIKKEFEDVAERTNKAFIEMLVTELKLDKLKFEIEDPSMVVQEAS